jgi:hypothetical protein
VTGAAPLPPSDDAAQTIIETIESIIHRDVGRNIAPLFLAARGGLRGAVAALAETAGPVGLITGFYVPSGMPPAAETDGPVAVALLATALRALGRPCRVCTDALCAAACRAALAAASAAAGPWAGPGAWPGAGEVPVDVPVDVVADPSGVASVVAMWRASGVQAAIAVERCGRTRDGAARNMRGGDVSAFTVLLDDLFLAGPWRTIAIGDGGNEIGMGALPAGLIAAHVAHGAAIACVTPAAHLIVAGVSHWGAYALIAGLAARHPDRRAALRACLDPGLDRAILEATMRDGPAVDGVTGVQAPTIDSLDMPAHHAVLLAIRAAV